MSQVSNKYNPEKHMIYLDNILFFGYYFFALCPFISPFPLESDLQPISLLVSCLVLLRFFSKVRFPHEWLGIGIVTGICTLIYLVNITTSTSQLLLVRKFINYISLFIIPLAGYNIFIKQNKVNENWIKCIIIIWFIAGVIEIFFPGFANILIPNARTSLSRGVVGLAPEPSFYGYTAIFLLLLSLNFKTHRIWFITLLLIQLILLAKSAIGILFLIILVCSLGMEFFIRTIRRVHSFSYSRICIVLCLLISIPFICISIFKHLTNYRIVSLFQTLLMTNINLFSLADIYAVDASTGQRLNAIMFSLQNFTFFPHGFNYNEIYRIMSGYGTTLYELGICGVILLLNLTYILFRGFSTHFSIALTVTIIMFAAIQLGSPTFSFLIAVALYNISSKNTYA